jgi:hypothetical protein
VPLRMCAASNPGGIGHGWVKKRFPIDGKRRERRVFIPAKIADTPHLDRGAYRASLARLSPTMQRQLEEGDWTVAEGLAFPEWRREIHCVPEFPVPPHWHRWEFMDHGISNPAAWYIAATDEAGNVVVFDSYYSPGLISAHCEAVLGRRPAWWPEYRDADGVLVRPSPRTWADPSVRNRTGQSPLTAKFQPETIASEYAKQSDGRISLALANNDPKEGRARVSEFLRLEPGRRRRTTRRTWPGRPRRHACTWCGPGAGSSPNSLRMRRSCRSTPAARVPGRSSTRRGSRVTGMGWRLCVTGSWAPGRRPRRRRMIRGTRGGCCSASMRPGSTKPRAPGGDGTSCDRDPGRTWTSCRRTWNPGGFVRPCPPDRPPRGGRRTSVRSPRLPGASALTAPGQRALRSTKKHTMDHTGRSSTGFIARARCDARGCG